MINALVFNQGVSEWTRPFPVLRWEERVIHIGNEFHNNNEALVSDGAWKIGVVDILETGSAPDCGAMG